MAISTKVVEEGKEMGCLETAGDLHELSILKGVSGLKQET